MCAAADSSAGQPACPRVARQGGSWDQRAAVPGSHAPGHCTLEGLVSCQSHRELLRGDFKQDGIYSSDTTPITFAPLLQPSEPPPAAWPREAWRDPLWELPRSAGTPRPSPAPAHQSFTLPSTCTALSCKTCTSNNIPKSGVLRPCPV